MLGNAVGVVVTVITTLSDCNDCLQDLFSLVKVEKKKTSDGRAAEVWKKT